MSSCEPPGNKNDIGRYLSEQGKLAEAESLFREVVSGRSQALGPTHPQTLSTQYELGIALARQGKRTQAKSLLSQVRDAQVTALGPDHPNVLKTARWLDQVQEHPESEQPRGG